MTFDKEFRTRLPGASSIAERTPPHAGHGGGLGSCPWAAGRLQTGPRSSLASASPEAAARRWRTSLPISTARRRCRSRGRSCQLIPFCIGPLMTNSHPQGQRAQSLLVVKVRRMIPSGQRQASGGAFMIQASCHCGEVVLDIAEAPSEIIECNCSICRRYGVLRAYYAPGRIEVRVHSGTDSYMWDDRSIALHRCRTCGCVTHWSAVDHTRNRMGVNARLGTRGLRTSSGAALGRSFFRGVSELTYPERDHQPAGTISLMFTTSLAAAL